jgi:phospholipase C
MPDKRKASISTAALAGTLPENLAKAAAASPRKFNLSQVKHLVFLMQENREHLDPAS